MFIVICFKRRNIQNMIRCGLLKVIFEKKSGSRQNDFTNFCFSSLNFHLKLKLQCENMVDNCLLKR